MLMEPNIRLCNMLISDDTTLILDGSVISLQTSLHVLNKYARMSGLKINVQKTKPVWIGSKKYCTEILDTQIKWNFEKPLIY
jgi:hypothetical protein